MMNFEALSISSMPLVLIHALLLTSLLGVVVSIGVTIFLRILPTHHSALRSSLLSLSLVVILLSLPISIAISIQREMTPATQITRFESEPLNSANLALGESNRLVSGEVMSGGKVAAYNYFHWLVGGYFLGLCLMSVRAFLGLRFQRRVYRQGQPIRDLRYQELFSKVVKKVLPPGRIRPRLVTLEQEPGTPPFVCGWFKPCVVVSLSVLNSLSPAEVEMVLTHELCHLRRRDQWFILIQRVAETLLFFHPGIWWLSKLSDRERENACDDMVLRSGYQADEYASSLVRVSELCQVPSFQPTPAATGKCSELKHRIARMMKRPSKPQPSSVIEFSSGFAALGLIVVLTICSMMLIAPQSVLADKQLDPVAAFEASRSKARERMKQDASHYQPGDQKTLETEYQRIARLRNTAGFRTEVEAFIKQYPKSNRAGCLHLYLARGVAESEREKFLKESIAKYADCFYGDGTQVAPYAMINLGYFYQATQKYEESRKLFQQVIEKYPNSIGHSQQLLRVTADQMLNPPGIEKIVPAHQAKDVAPTTTELRIVFAQPMRQGSHSIVGGGEHFPKIVGKPAWVDDRTMVLKVELKPDHQYHLGLNSKKFKNFKTAHGVSTIPYSWSFKTAPMKGAGIDTLKLLGKPFAELVTAKGQPASVAGPREGYQTWEYPGSGLSIVMHGGKVVHYVASNRETYKTAKGITIGSSLDEVTATYGEYTRQENVVKWFAGDEEKVLYHHPKYNKYKINYYDHDVIFSFDKDKKVEGIAVGSIYKKVITGSDSDESKKERVGKEPRRFEFGTEFENPVHREERRRLPATLY